VEKMTKYEVIIIGGGPAGLTSGLYASRAGLKSLLIERAIFGGQIVNARQVDNYPGFPEGISGFELASLMHQQATRYGLQTVNSEVTAVKQESVYTVITSASNYETESVIIAAGSENRKLGVPGESELLGQGVSYCATCDGFLFREMDVAVIGGGDTAITDAMELIEHASNVYLIHRRDQLRASQILQEKALSRSKLHPVWNSVVEEIIGDSRVSGLRLRNVKTGETSRIDVSGVFVAVGVIPNSRVFADVVELDNGGFIKANQLMATSRPGILVAGDIRADSPRQISAAVGDGATAALSAVKYIREKA
jgi:thioredoxin reductase (NADPH)